MEIQYSKKYKVISARGIHFCKRGRETFNTSTKSQEQLKELRGADQGFPRMGANTKGERQPITQPIFPENCMKTKEIGREGLVQNWLQLRVEMFKF